MKLHVSVSKNYRQNKYKEFIQAITYEEFIQTSRYEEILRARWYEEFIKEIR
jgi:hypothetical protein